MPDSAAILIVVTHLLGVGHLTRAATIGRGLAAAGHRVTLVSGGRPAPLVSTNGLAFVQLPPVQCRGTDFRTLLDEQGQPIDDQRRQARIDLLGQTFDAVRPDLVITETFPFGRRQLKAEFLALLAACAARPVPPVVLASIRDILNPPSSPAKADQALDHLGRFYDGVLVHGDPALTPLKHSWPVVPALERRLSYTGYIAEAAAPSAVASSGEIVVSGGGSAASLPLFRASAAAAADWPGPERWRLLVGHGVAAADFAAIAALAGPAAVVERARPDFPALLAAARLSISQAGYNTVLDLARAGVPAVLVPFEQGQEAEQRLRAARLAAAGLAELVPEAELTPARLTAAAQAALNRPRCSTVAFPVEGVAGTVAVVTAALDQGGREQRAWSRLGHALDRAAAQGVILDFWWRDDDAVAPSPALERLLALAGRFALPLALAVIPAGATAALAGRLAAETKVSVLIHGIAHDNHAPAGQKKRELGELPPAVLADGLAQCRRLFGAQALPVLVPPWNRIDPALIPALPALGYRGLSTANRRPAAEPVAGLVQVNSHIDPIAWKQGGGVRPADQVINDLAARIEAQLDRQDPPEPIGLLTHHLVHDGWIWRLTEQVLDRLSQHRAVRFRAASELFALTPPAP